LLEKQFIINKDYNLLLYQQVKQCNQTKGGHNKETFMLNLKTFKGVNESKTEKVSEL